MKDDIYTSDTERERAIQYSRTREWLKLAGIVYGAAVSLLALQSGFSARLRAWAVRISPQRLGPVMAYVAAGMVSYFLASLPLSYYEGYSVEHRYGLSNQTRRAWFIEQLKGVGVGIVLGAPLVHGI